jgi:hypothetical protein
MSSTVDVIKKFIENDKKSTLFLIEAVNGKKVSGYTEYENDDEIICTETKRRMLKNTVIVGHLCR